MTSITHSSPSSTVLPSVRLGGGRFRFGAESRAVRVGLGVAIAAVMAGDVYAVLRSPVSEGSTSADRAGAASATAVEDGAGAASGPVATTPFGEAAWAAELAGRAPVVALRSGAGAGGPAAAVPAGPPEVGSVPALSVPAVSQPALPAAGPAPTFLPPAGPSNGGDNGSTPVDPPAESPLTPLIAMLPEVPVVSDAVVPVVEEVVNAVPVPTSDPAPAAATSVVPLPVAVPSAPSGLGL